MQADEWNSSNNNWRARLGCRNINLANVTLTPLVTTWASHLLTHQTWQFGALSLHYSLTVIPYTFASCTFRYPFIHTTPLTETYYSYIFTLCHQYRLEIVINIGQQSLRLLDSDSDGFCYKTVFGNFPEFCKVNHFYLCCIFLGQKKVDDL